MPAKQVLPDKATSRPLRWEAASAPGLRGWRGGGLRRPWQALTNPPALPLVREENAGKDWTKGKVQGWDLLLTALGPAADWAYTLGGQLFLPKNYSPSANKNRIQLLPIWFPHGQAEARRAVLVTFNPYRYAVISLQCWVRCAFQACHHGLWLCSVN